MSKRELRNRLYMAGLPGKQGLPSVVKPNFDKKPERAMGLQPRSNNA
jgi:hypothetical protein